MGHQPLAACKPHGVQLGDRYGRRETPALKESNDITSSLSRNVNQFHQTHIYKNNMNLNIAVGICVTERELLLPAQSVLKKKVEYTYHSSHWSWCVICVEVGRSSYSLLLNNMCTRVSCSCGHHVVGRVWCVTTSSRSR